MAVITSLLLENEMDVVVAQKRMLRVAEFFSLSLSTQTTISTAVAEITRVIVDKTDSGKLDIAINAEDDKYFISGSARFNPAIEIRANDEGLRYAKVLVPAFEYDPLAKPGIITVKIGIPKAFRITDKKVAEALEFFKNIKPSTPYEQLKFRNSQLSQQAVQIEEELYHSRLLDEKKNEFISVASHELKTPLTTLKAFTQLAVDAGKAEGSEKMMRYLHKINGQVQKLQVLIQQLLDVSKIESGKMDYHKEDTSWDAYMEEIMPILKNLVPAHRLSWTAAQTSEPLLVFMDVLRMEQVFTNLVGNAAKYSSPGSSIYIESRADDKQLLISVRDEGVGIPQHSISRIFTKYFRDESIADKFSGFGMGLYITSGIIEEHGGRIWAESVPGQGSTFWFTLPITQ